jgi:hypothetical protein
MVGTPYDAEYNNTIVVFFLELKRKGPSKPNDGKSAMFNDAR